MSLSRLTVSVKRGFIERATVLPLISADPLADMRVFYHTLIPTEMAGMKVNFLTGQNGRYEGAKFLNYHTGLPV